MKIVENQHFTEERALFFGRELTVKNCTFSVGESPFKESENIIIDGCNFISRYPVWYSKHVTLENCTATVESRAGIWYTEDITLKNCVIDAPKCVRRAHGIKMENVKFTGGAETLWHCSDILLNNVEAHGDYFFMNSEDAQIDGLYLNGKYSFDGVKNVVIRNSVLDTKDAFWNSENVTVYDSVVKGEYIGWNAKNLTFVNCTVESLQGLCYIENLVMKSCKTPNTTLAFEYSSVDAEIIGEVDSVLNPSSGRIVADGIRELMLEKERIDTSKVEIILRNGEK